MLCVEFEAFDKIIMKYVPINLIEIWKYAKG